jgi:hypothetical protein
MSEYIAGDELDGDFVAGDADILGRIARRVAANPRGSRPRVFTRPPLPATPAQPTRSELRSFLGMGMLTFTNTSPTVQSLEVEPQESFRGERLIIDWTYTPAASEAAPLVTVARIEVGTQPQSPSVQFAAPAAMFRADAVGSDLDLQVAYRGTKMIVQIAISAAPPSGATLRVSAGFYGQWIR